MMMMISASVLVAFDKFGMHGHSAEVERYTQNVLSITPLLHHAGSLYSVQAPMHHRHQPVSAAK